MDIPYSKETTVGGGDVSIDASTTLDCIDCFYQYVDSSDAIQKVLTKLALTVSGPKSESSSPWSGSSLSRKLRRLLWVNLSLAWYVVRSAIVLIAYLRYPSTHPIKVAHYHMDGTIKYVSPTVDIFKAEVPAFWIGVFSINIEFLVQALFQLQVTGELDITAG